MDKLKKYWFIWFLVFLVVILLVLRLKYSNQVADNDLGSYYEAGELEPNNNKSEEINNTNYIYIDEDEETTEEVLEPSPTITTSTSRGDYVFTKPDETKVYSNDSESDNLSDYVDIDSLEPLLPYQGKYFKVEKYLKQGYLEVIVKNENDFSKAREEVEVWIEENNSDLEETKVIYLFE